MARLRHSESLAPSEHESLYREPSLPAARRPSATPSASRTSPSPSPTTSSDKENRQITRTSKAPRSAGLADRSQDTAARAAKRRRLEDQTTRSSRALSEDEDEDEEVENESERIYYDPNQDAEEQRDVRKSLRSLTKDIQQKRNEWLDPNSNGLRDALSKADETYHHVKQTHDATIDSRFLVDAGDLTFRKSTHLVLGDGAQGIDVDEFVSKCISFMRRGGVGAGPSSSTQRRRRQNAGAEESDEEGQDQGDALDWELLGSQACAPVIARPPTVGFLLGPLSVQKRARKQAVRRANQRQRNVETTQPQELKSQDLERNEKSNLTQMCTAIHRHLKKTIQEGEEAINRASEANADEAEQNEILERYNMCDTGGVSLFKYAFNPKSFGQTVENLFYISFLIKDGHLGIQADSEGQPTLIIPQKNYNGDDEDETENSGRKSHKKHQAVFNLDHDIWREVIEFFSIRDSGIPHREEEVHSISTNGWYN